MTTAPAGEWQQAHGRTWTRTVDLFGAASAFVAVQVHEECGACNGNGATYGQPYNPYETGTTCGECGGTGNMPDNGWARQEPIDDPQEMYLRLRDLVTDDESLPLSSTDGRDLGLPQGRYVVGIAPRLG
jgi:hypothetical protein